MSTNEEIQAEVDRNYEAFTAVLPDLMKQHPGQFAVLRHKEVISTFESIEAAIHFAVAKYPDGLFSVQQITDTPAAQGFFSYAIALSSV